jgi:hypothetical protein
MDIQTTKTNGHYFTVVRDGAPVVHITSKYVTRRMAEAAAKCWIAFHGEVNMINDGEVFDVRRQGDQVWITITADDMRKRIANAERFGCEVTEHDSLRGPYIQIGRNGSSYGHYFRRTA